MKVLITAPSLAEEENVSGISSVAGQIIKHGVNEFYHFTAGRKDNKKQSIGCFFKQTFLVPQFLHRIRREKIDVVHINTALAPLSIIRDSALAAAARFAGKPVLLHLHGGRFFTHKFNNRFLKQLTGKMLHRAKIVVVLSEIEKKFIENRWQNPDVRVLENAVAIDELPERKSETSDKTIIFLGRLHEDKGLREIIEACRILKNENFQFNFKCYGAGDAKEFFITEMTKTLGDKFYYGGIAAGQEKRRAFAESDIFLLPSYYEGLPLAMLEAMAAGCVPVVSDVGSTGIVVKDGVNGFLIEPKNVPQLVEKLRLLISGRVDWDKMHQGARKTIEERFNLKNYMKKLEGIYAEMMN